MSDQPLSHELERLINASIDGDLSEQDEELLRSLLRNDQAMRRRYLEFMQLHAELNWDHGARAGLPTRLDTGLCSNTSLDVSPLLPQQRSHWLAPGLMVAVASIGLLFALLQFYVNGTSDLKSSAKILGTIEMTLGTVSFLSDDGSAGGRTGEVFDNLDRGTNLPAGNLLVEGESSIAQWRFLDGTIITVTGDADLSFTDEPQKLIRVSRGTLTAEVKPQPIEQPLIIETATARVEVIGTVFTLAAGPEQTRVNVDEGRVRIKRLVDGDSIEVSGDHTCVASLDSRTRLSPESPNKSAIGWLHQFNQPPPESWKGEWMAAEGDLPPRVRAVACLLGRQREPQQTPIVHFGITARRGDTINLGVLPTTGALRIRFQTKQAVGLQIMLGLLRDDGVSVEISKPSFQRTRVHFNPMAGER